MNKKQRQKKSVAWTPEKFQSFASEIDAIRKEVFGKLGSEDVEYIKKVRKFSRNFEIAGRFLIHFSLDPLTWFMGVTALALHKQLETTEIGHCALHGAWDNLPNAEELRSATFKWDMPVEEESWKHGHNILHHQYTNVIGRDPDFHYGYLRLSENVPWLPRNLLQIPITFGVAPIFTWVMNPHFSGFSDLFRKTIPEYANAIPDKKIKTAAKSFSKSLKKLVPYLAKNYVFWPMLAGPFFPKILMGNALAETMRDLYTWASIFPGHLTEGSAHFDKEFKAKGRGEWYKSQIESTNNYAVNDYLSVLCGALDYQIEHHLFPKLPPNRLREIGPQVQALCKRYDVTYQKDSWPGAWKKVLTRMARHSLP